MLTALVVDPSADARRRAGALLRLGGWDVVEAPDAVDAFIVLAGHAADLVVTEIDLPGETGLSLLGRLRSAGCRARFLVVTRQPTDRVRVAAAGAGALACLAKPIDPWALIDFLRGRTAGPAAPGPHRRLRVVRDAQEVDTGTWERLHEMYLGALPHRLAVIAERARDGDAIAVAAAAQTLAGASGQLGHPEIADVCQEIAAEARRGVVSQSRLLRLQRLTGSATRTSPPAAAALPAGV